MKRMDRPLVSAVITTKNEEKNIGNCLKSIRLQTYPKNKIEIIVVDHPGSTDKTREIASLYTNNVFIQGPERSSQRNFGVKKAKGEIVIYLDADMFLSSSVIEEGVEELKDSSLAALYVPEIILGNSYWSKVRRFERSFYDGTVVDCVRIIRKDVFEKTGGFDSSFSGPEDWDLDKKIKKIGKVEILDKYDFNEINKKLAGINYRAVDIAARLSRLSQKPFIYHNEATFNVKKYFRKKSYYAKSFSAYIKKWGKDDPDIRKQFGFWYRYFGVFTVNGKYKKLLSHLAPTIGMFFLRFLTGLTFLLRKF